MLDKKKPKPKDKWIIDMPSWDGVDVGDLHLGLLPYGDGTLVFYSGKLQAVAPVVIANLFSQTKAQVGRCAEERCKRFFVGDKRKSYCSRKCANLANVRKWMADHRAEVSKKNRSYYVQKVKKKINPKEPNKVAVISRSEEDKKNKMEKNSEEIPKVKIKRR